MTANDKHFCENCGDYYNINFKKREKTYEFKDEKITINERYSVCTVCETEVYDEESGNETLKKLKQKYYEIKHGMNIQDFKEIRWNYNLSQKLFAKILNWGIASVKRYETAASLPDSTHIAIYKILQKNPQNIIDFYKENKSELSSGEIEKAEKSLKKYLLPDQIENKIYELLISILNDQKNKNLNGLNNFKPIKLFNMVLYFSQNGVLKTKLMKLLWYSDFLMFKKHQISISGTPYINFPYGPVPDNHDLLLGAMKSINAIKVTEEEISNGYLKIIIENVNSFKEDFFTEKELETLEYVYNYFKNFGSKDITEYSHREAGWRQTTKFENISYEYAKSLSLN